MTCGWLIALGFALMLTEALLLYTAGTEIRHRESTALAALAGVVLFLGIAHAGTDVLVGNVPFRILTNPALPAATAAAGILAGLVVTYLLWPDGALVRPACSPFSGLLRRARGRGWF